MAVFKPQLNKGTLYSVFHRASSNVHSSAVTSGLSLCAQSYNDSYRLETGTVKDSGYEIIQ